METYHKQMIFRKCLTDADMTDSESLHNIMNKCIKVHNKEIRDIIQVACIKRHENNNDEVKKDTKIQVCKSILYDIYNEL